MSTPAEAVTVGLELVHQPGWEAVAERQALDSEREPERTGDGHAFAAGDLLANAGHRRQEATYALHVPRSVQLAQPR